MAHFKSEGPLTPRQREVLDLVAAGFDVEAIAQELRISEWTVRDHVKALRAKLGVRRMRDLAEYA